MAGVGVGVGQAAFADQVNDLLFVQQVFDGWPAPFRGVEVCVTVTQTPDLLQLDPLPPGIGVTRRPTVPIFSRSV
jgi:hypothetical protein